MLLSTLVSYVVGFLVKLALGWLADRRAHDEAKALGAAEQARQSTVTAEREEARAAAAGRAAVSRALDADDGFRRND